MQVTINITAMPAKYQHPEQVVLGALMAIPHFGNVESRHDDGAVVARFSWTWGSLLEPLDRLAWVLGCGHITAHWTDVMGQGHSEVYGPDRAAARKRAAGETFTTF